MRCAVMIQQETRWRLKRRAHNKDQTLDEIVNQLLDETIVETEIDEIVEATMNQYEHISCVRIHHPHPTKDVSLIHITIHSGDVWTPGELVHIFGPEHRAVVIDPDSDESRRYQILIQVTSDIPSVSDSKTHTLVYATGSGSPDLEPDVGLANLRQKLFNPDDWDISQNKRYPDDI